MSSKAMEDTKRFKELNKMKGYVVPMTNEQRKEYGESVKEAEDISSGKKNPPYLKNK